MKKVKKRMTEKTKSRRILAKEITMVRKTRRARCRTTSRARRSELSSIITKLEKLRLTEHRVRIQTTERHLRTSTPPRASRCSSRTTSNTTEGRKSLRLLQMVLTLHLLMILKTSSVNLSLLARSTNATCHRITKSRVRKTTTLTRRQTRKTRETWSSNTSSLRLIIRHRRTDLKADLFKCLTNQTYPSDPNSLRRSLLKWFPSLTLVSILIIIHQRVNSTTSTIDRN